MLGLLGRVTPFLRDRNLAQRGVEEALVRDVDVVVAGEGLRHAGFPPDQGLVHEDR